MSCYQNISGQKQKIIKIVFELRILSFYRKQNIYRSYYFFLGKYIVSYHHVYIPHLCFNFFQCRISFFYSHNSIHLLEIYYPLIYLFGQNFMSYMEHYLVNIKRYCERLTGIKSHFLVAKPIQNFSFVNVNFLVSDLTIQL